MLTLVINPGGRARVVTIARALDLLGVELYQQPGRRPERTPEERRQHQAQLSRERRRRMQLRQEAGR